MPKKIVLFLGVCLLIIGFSIYAFRIKPTVTGPSLVMNGTMVNIEIVSSAEDLARGLSGRRSLQPNQGMLFLFPTYGIPSFWMKDMLFAIDIIWIRDDKVMDISAHVQPPESTTSVLPTYHPNTYVNKVLEVQSGFVDRHNIRPGTSVEYINSN